MTIKGRLLSSIAIVTRFQTEWQAPLPSGISQPYVVLENHGGGYKAEKKFDDIIIPFNTIPACDRQTATRRQQ